MRELTPQLPNNNAGLHGKYCFLSESCDLQIFGAAHLMNLCRGRSQYFTTFVIVQSFEQMSND